MSGIISYTAFGGKSGNINHPVAFSIGLTDTGSNAIAYLGTIPYAGIRYNYGGGMHSTNGIFTAPVGGIYHFTATVYNYSGTTNYDWELLGNGQTTFARTMASVSGLGAPLVATVYIRKDEEVRVRNAVNGSRNAYTGTYSHSYFSGELIGTGTWQ